MPDVSAGIVVERIEVKPDRVIARVRIADERELRTSDWPGTAERGLTLLPELARHTCRNEGGRSFAEELASTETAHLLEHVACELMALSGSPRRLQGETSWDFVRGGRGVFDVALEYDVDLVALGALKASVPIVLWLLRGEGPPPDVDAQVELLRRLRRD